MGIAAAIAGIVGGLAAIVGVLRLAEIPATPIINSYFTWEAWFWIAAILILGSIAMLLGRRPEAD